MSSYPRITINNLAARLDFHYDTKSPLMIWGAPGSGKSQTFEQWAKAKAESLSLAFNDTRRDDFVMIDPAKTFALVDLRGSGLDPLDVRGGLHLNEQTRTLETFMNECLPNAEKMGHFGAIIFDELPECDPSILKPISNIIWDRACGPFVMPDGWGIFAAGNEPGQGSSAKRLPSQLNNRMGHVGVDPEPVVWAAHLKDVGGYLPLGYFVSGRPEIINTWASKDDVSFSTPRSLMAVSDVYQKVDDPDLRASLAAGYIGEGIVAEFEGFLTLINSGRMATWSDIQSRPFEAPIGQPGEDHGISLIYAAISNIQHHVKTKADMPAVMQYISRMPKEFQNVMMLCIMDKDKGLMDCEEVNQWRSNNPGAV